MGTQSEWNAKRRAAKTEAAEAAAFAKHDVPVTESAVELPEGQEVPQADAEQSPVGDSADQQADPDPQADPGSGGEAPADQAE